MTAGELHAAHVGAKVSLEVTQTSSNITGEVTTTTRTVEGAVQRVQHNPGETLLALGSWSGALDPDHPITITITETGA